MDNLWKTFSGRAIVEFRFKLNFQNKWFRIRSIENEKGFKMFITDKNRKYRGVRNISMPVSPKGLKVDVYQFDGKYSCYNMYEFANSDGSWAIITHSNRIIAIMHQSEGVTQLFPLYEANSYERKFAFSFENDDYKMVGTYGRGSTVIRIQNDGKRYDLTLNNSVSPWDELRILFTCFNYGRFTISGHKVCFEIASMRKLQSIVDMYNTLPRQMPLFSVPPIEKAIG